MILEEALKLMREGKKIRHPLFEDDEYLMGCYVTIPGMSYEDAKRNGISVVKMKGDCQHPDMRPKFNADSFPHAPCICIFLLTADNWEVID